MYCSKCGSWAVEGETLCGKCGAALQVENAPSPTPAGTGAAAPRSGAAPALRYSGFWRRFGAALVDFAVCTPFHYAIEAAFGRRLFEPAEWDAGYWGLQTLLMVLSWLYSALLESSRWQATLGQQLLDIRVTDSQGRRIGFGRATGRHFAQLLSLLTLCIGYLMIAFTAKKQALHDVVSGCLLVRPSPATQPAPPPYLNVYPPAPVAQPGAPSPAAPANIPPYSTGGPVS